MAECNCEYTPPEQRPCMTCRMREAVGSPTDLLAYVQHRHNCDALQPMWHQGPCDCGLVELLKKIPAWVKPHLGPGAFICPQCGDRGVILTGRDDLPLPCTNCEAGEALKQRNG